MARARNDGSVVEQTAASGGRKAVNFDSRIGRTYSTDDLHQIAEATGVEISAVEHQRKLLDVAAWWFRRDVAAPKRTSPSRLRPRVDSLNMHLEKALKRLGVEDKNAVGDGPFDLELLTYLVQSGDEEDTVIRRIE